MRRRSRIECHIFFFSDFFVDFAFIWSNSDAGEFGVFLSFIGSGASHCPAVAPMKGSVSFRIVLTVSCFCSSTDVGVVLLLLLHSCVHVLGSDRYHCVFAIIDGAMKLDISRSRVQDTVRATANSICSFLMRSAVVSGRSVT